jgi:hypothetical protein
MILGRVKRLCDRIALLKSSEIWWFKGEAGR